MEAAWVTAIAVTAMIVAVISIWRVLNWLWLTPKKLEKLLREQGFQGNPYRILVGDTEDIQKMLKRSQSKPMDVSDDDILQRFLCHIQQNINRYGLWYLPWCHQTGCFVICPVTFFNYLHFLLFHHPHRAQVAPRFGALSPPCQGPSPVDLLSSPTSSPTTKHF
ncbi:hypothetical protein PIB30_017094 [Stylosanthes scabra]|uniref:Uncharacterized protein n=1 Tax=Stylosanthes scabra TaxID=79078 RepID=A0ABU6T979_9FABA|nr:hypothetical protein [Stylosanthes scabra]